MCGIAGFIDLARRDNADELGNKVRRMSQAIIHRGPDDAGEWVDAAGGIALGFRRLAIVDLSATGHQPMTSESGRFILIFNGEIYNYPALRQELECPLSGSPPRFRGTSDTEVMLAAFERWGVDAAVRKFNGMFAFALWDRTERTLTLCRDRLGEKPLYYGRQGKTFLFGSELKSFRTHPDFEGRIDRNALALYMRHNCIPAPHSIYVGIRKLPPATIMVVREDGSLGGPTPYWSAEQAAECGAQNELTSPDDILVEQLDALLRQSVKMRMMADVPLGAFLSGGIDSSTVVSLMQAQSTRPVKTFSIGYREGDYSESDDARAVANHLGTEHTELIVTPEQALAVIPRLPTLYDEPFSDSSQIPTFLVCQMAREHVTVGLSGDGGDELFGGYSRYLWGGRLWRRTGWLPRGARTSIASAMSRVSPERWDRTYSRFSRVLPRSMRQRNPSDKLQKLADVLSKNSPEEIYYGLVSHWKEPAALVLGSTEPQTVVSDSRCWPESLRSTALMMYLDLVTYLPDDILAKVDRASMGVSLEARVPLLDHRIVEYAWRVPLQAKIRNGQGKWLLRQVLYRYVPKAMVERPKMGFNVPVDSWLRGPLRDWAEDLLDEGRMRSDGYLDPQPIRQKWAEHLAGQRNWQYHLWDVLMFKAWLRDLS